MKATARLMWPPVKMSLTPPNYCLLDVNGIKEWVGYTKKANSKYYFGCPATPGRGSSLRVSSVGGGFPRLQLSHAAGEKDSEHPERPVMLSRMGEEMLDLHPQLLGSSSFRRGSTTPCVLGEGRGTLDPFWVVHLNLVNYSFPFWLSSSSTSPLVFHAWCC